jgi:hypothetical protein
MFRHHVLAFALLSVLAPGAAPALADPSERQIEIYRIAPGQHSAFLRFIALCDEANARAGVPPRQLYVHEDGASWDFILVQPTDYTPEQSKALDAAYKALKIPQGGKFFVAIRQYIVEHTDTVATGPTTAAEWLKKLD